MVILIKNKILNLISHARKILAQNWKDGFTIPTSKLYPFQWHWDSGFVALGLAHHDLDRAMTEINSMFSGQWENGMLPHILFHSENEKTYFPNYNFWNSAVNPGAPEFPKSSGITQPPVFGFVLESLLDLYGAENEEVVNFVKNIFPKLLKYHEFLYTYRDAEEEGLFFIFHPWESGRDNSPLWDKPLGGIDLDNATLPDYTRRDTSLADASERPTQDQYDRYVYLLELGKKHRYDGPGIARESPFLVQDCMMNAILIRSNEALLNIASKLHLDAGKLPEWQSKSKANFSSKFWNEDLKFFVTYDQRNQQPILYREIGGIIPLFAGVATKAQAKYIADYLQNLHDRGFYLCPSFDVDSPLFDSKRYWRGPIWPQMNWMIYHGLKKYGYSELAEIVRTDLITLVEKLGFYEYFEAEKSKVTKLTKGYGGNNFSWTASSIIDFLNS